MSSPAKPKNAKAPAPPSPEKIKQVKGKLMYEKSKNIASAETARRESTELRADWAKSAGIRRKGKGKGKGKGKAEAKGKGKGKGESKGKGKGKYKVVKRASIVDAANEVDSEKQKAAIERLEKRLKAKEQKLIKSESPPKKKKPRFIAVSKIHPEHKGVNVYAKVVSKADSENYCEVVVGDSTGIVTLSVPKDNVGACSVGAILRVQNAHVKMVKGYIRVHIDKWALLKAADAAETKDFGEDEVLMKNDVSAVEYELAA